MLHLIPIPDPLPSTEIERLAARIAMIAAPYPSERALLAGLLVELVAAIRRDAQS